MMTEHDRRLVSFLGELLAEPRELRRREPTRVTAVAGLVVRVDADDAQALQLPREVRRFLAREEVIVEAVVALPFADPAGGIRGPAVRGSWFPRVTKTSRRYLPNLVSN